MTEYFRKGHLYLETPDGRKDIFYMFKEQIEDGLKGNNISKAISSIKSLKSYLKGDNLIFLNDNISNAYTLRKKKDEIKDDALKALRDCIDVLKKVFLKTENVSDKFSIIFILIKFMPAIRDLPLKHDTDLHLLMFHTLLYLDSFRGKEEDRVDLGEIVVRGCGRYDCAEVSEAFIRDTGLRDFLEHKVLQKITPYEEYIKILKGTVKKMKMANAFDEGDFSPLVFTSNLFYLFNDLFNGFLRDAYLENRERIGSFINSRCNDLIEDKDQKTEIINILMTIMDEKSHQIMEQTPNSSESQEKRRARLPARPAGG